MPERDVAGWRCTLCGELFRSRAEADAHEAIDLEGVLPIRTCEGMALPDSRDDRDPAP